MGKRAETVRVLANLIARTGRTHPVRVAVDGRTASGKTTLADELARELRSLGREVIRTSVDGFHRPKSERYARGRHSAEGYYHDARDLGAIRRMLLDPLGPTGDGLYRTVSFDLERDVPLEEPAKLAPSDSILIVDGTFLQRPELADAWDLTILVRVSEEIAAARGIARDATKLGSASAAEELYARRYRPAFALYEHACGPEERADVIVDNNDFDAPVVVARRAAT